MKKVVVLIPMFNHADLTDKCVEYVLKNAGIPVRIVVIDDGSERPYSNSLTETIRIPNNSGFTKAVNEGLRALRLDYDYVLVLNNDAEGQPDFVKSLVELAESDKRIGVVGSTRIGSWEPYREAAGGADLTTGLVYASQEKDAFKEPVQCVWFPFCSVLLSKDCVEMTWLLDEKMRNHNSDNDYCLRAIFQEFAVVVEPKSKVFHHQSCTWLPMGITPYADQKIFASKWFGAAMNEILGAIPINQQMGKWGKLEFHYEEKETEKVPEIIV